MHAKPILESQQSASSFQSDQKDYSLQKITSEATALQPKSQEAVKLRSLLSKAGITEMTYQTLRRQKAVTFMRPRRKGDGEIPREQLLALKLFGLLRAHGLRASIAVLAVEAAFPAITEFVCGGPLQPVCRNKVGVKMLFQRGRVVAVPIEALDRDRSSEVGRIELDLRGVSQLVPCQ